MDHLPFVNTPEFQGTVKIASSVKFGKNCKVYQFATICHDTLIGEGVVVGSNVWIGKNCVIGSRTRIQHGAFIPSGTITGIGVFIGPNVTMTDDKYPSVGRAETYAAMPPRLEDGCSLGAGCVILPGVTIGHHAMVGAGAVVTNDVQPHSTVVGVPASEHRNSL